MVKSSTLLALVGHKEIGEFSPKKLIIYGCSIKKNKNNVNNQSCLIGNIICSSFPFKHNIISVELNSEFIIVIESNCYDYCILHIYNVMSMKSIKSLNLGIITTSSLSKSISNTYGNIYYAYEIKDNLGLVYLYNISQLCPIINFKAHESDIYVISFNTYNTAMATCSKKGTIIRIFSVPECYKLYTLKRGVTTSLISSIVFGANEYSNKLIVLSQKGTIHLFNLNKIELSSKHSSNNNNNNNNNTINEYSSNLNENIVNDINNLCIFDNNINFSFNNNNCDYNNLNSNKENQHICYNLLSDLNNNDNSSDKYKFNIISNIYNNKNIKNYISNFLKNNEYTSKTVTNSIQDIIDNIRSYVSLNNECFINNSGIAFFDSKEENFVYVITDKGLTSKVLYHDKNNINNNTDPFLSIKVSTNYLELKKIC